MNDVLNLNDFDFILPPKNIALQPKYPRDSSKLLYLYNNRIQETTFKHIINYLPKNSLLIVNDSKVYNARLRCIDRFNRKYEILFVKKKSSNTFFAKVKPLKKLIKQQILYTVKNRIKLVVELIDINNAQALISIYNGLIDVDYLLNKNGEIPIPPYIVNNRENKDLVLDDQKNYQTVYSKKYSSIAAPTAGLHFTENLIKNIKNKGIDFISITLDIGLGTFDKITKSNILNKTIHKESFYISKSVAEKINYALKKKYIITSVGTTTLRALESSFENDKINYGELSTDLFIQPGYKFNVVNQLITNFHLPKSSLYLLVCSFGGINNLKKAYSYAIEKQFRFYSYGDAMMIKSK